MHVPEGPGNGKERSRLQAAAIYGTGDSRVGAAKYEQVAKCRAQVAALGTGRLGFGEGRSNPAQIECDKAASLCPAAAGSLCAD